MRTPTLGVTGWMLFPELLPDIGSVNFGLCGVPKDNKDAITFYNLTGFVEIVKEQGMTTSFSLWVEKIRGKETQA